MAVNDVMSNFQLLLKVDTQTVQQCALLK